MSSTRIPPAVEKVKKLSEFRNTRNKDNSKDSAKESPAKTEDVATKEGESRRRRRSRTRRRRGRGDKVNLEEALATTDSKAPEVNVVQNQGPKVKATPNKQSNKPRTPKKKPSREFQAIAHSGAVIREENRGSAWRISPSLGGRFLTLDSIFSRDEKFFLLAHNDSLKVYSTKTSLQVRAYDLDSKLSPAITSFKLDPRDPNRVYIGTSTCQIILWNWATGELVQTWKLKDIHTIQHLAVCADEEVEDEDVVGIVYVAASSINQRSVSIQRHRLLKTGTISKKIYGNNRLSPVECIQILDRGNILALIHERTLVIGNKTAQVAHRKKVWGIFREYPMSFRLVCMDTNLSSEIVATHGAKKSNREGGHQTNRLGDVVVGDDHGALHLFHDVLRSKEVSTSAPVISRLHWHRSKVWAVKWALDGKYIVSGGSETVLVVWQVETSRRQFLPHLGATIRNLVVSPNDSLYAVGLADNSVMILSTTELKPTANVTGIQSRVLNIEKGSEPLRFPCVMHPTLPNRLLLATPSSQTDPTASSSYLQTFDIFANRQISRQALTRNNATTFNHGPDDCRIVEPGIPHIAITTDGEWLASIDEWIPPKKRSFLPPGHHSADEDDDDDREVSLKFWKWSEKSKSWDLVTIVASPHPSISHPGTEEVLDLVATPKRHGFATVGADGSVRLWKSKIRTRAGVPVRGENGGVTTWSCRRVIKLSKGKKEKRLLASNLHNGLTAAGTNDWWGRAAFSEDNSALAVAVPCSVGKDSAIHIADTASGSIRHFLSGLQVGKTNGLAILERHIIILGTSKLLVWNMVNGAVQWEIPLGILPATVNSITHLAADPASQTFAVAISQTGPSSQPRTFIFEATHPAPVHIENLQHNYQIMALRATSTGKGYITLDNQARVRCLSPTLTGTVQQISLEEDSESQVEDESAIGTLSGAYLSNPAKGDAVNSDNSGNDDGVVSRVVRREELENVLDAVPSYAVMSLERTYDKVLALFVKEPLVDGDESEQEGKVKESDIESESDSGLEDSDAMEE